MLVCRLVRKWLLQFTDTQIDVSNLTHCLLMSVGTHEDAVLPLLLATPAPLSSQLNYSTVFVKLISRVHTMTL